MLGRFATDCLQPAEGATFLVHLAAPERASVEPHVEVESVTRGTVLFDAVDAADFIYFPQGPLISLEQSNGVEVALVGREGLAGWPALAGCKSSLYRAVVRGVDGIVLKVPTAALMPLLLASPSMSLMLNRFVTAVGLQMAETISASALHRIDMRLARWLLLRHDRATGDQILVQHDEIAENLGTRRASITDCLHVIEGNGIVRCRRGRIIIRDRTALEAMATGCYGAAEALYRELIGGMGKRAAVPQPWPTMEAMSIHGEVAPLPLLLRAAQPN